MKKFVFALALTALSLTSVPQAATAFDNTEHPLGAGLELGYPNALTVKYYLAEDMAVQAGIGLPGFLRTGLMGTMDFIFELRDIVNADVDEFSFFPYIGVGGKAFFWYNCRWFNNCGSVTQVGGRVPVGLGMHLADEPIEIAFQVAPGFAIRNYYYQDPRFRITLDVNLALRYYF